MRRVFVRFSRSESFVHTRSSVGFTIITPGLGFRYTQAADRLRRRGVGPEMLLGLLAAAFIVTQLALILRLPIPSYLLWAVVAAVGAATVLSFAILAGYFPKELAGRANGALNLFHIGAAFAMQYATGVVVQQWAPEAGHYPAIAYQTAFALSLVAQVAAWIWFVMPRPVLKSRRSAEYGDPNCNPSPPFVRQTRRADC